MFKEISSNMFWMECKTSLEFFHKLGEGQIPLAWAKVVNDII